jgi:hypothetical protein
MDQLAWSAIGESLSRCGPTAGKPDGGSTLATERELREAASYGCDDNKTWRPKEASIVNAMRT